MSGSAVVVGINRGACDALESAGISVTVLDHGTPSERLPRSVRYRACPSYGAGAAEEWVAFLEETARELPARPVLFAASDSALLAIAAWRARLDRTYDVACSSPDVVRLLVSKLAFAEWANRMNMPIPESHVVHSEAELAPIIDRIPLPCIVKPEHTFTLEEREGRKLFWARTAPDIDAGVRACLREGMAVVLQADISGVGSPQWSLAGVCDQASRIRNPVLAQKLRQVEWGAGTAMETVPMDAQMLALGQDLATKLHLRGLFEIEFRTDPHGRPLIIEVNPRIWRQVKLPAVAGVNLVHDAYRMARGEEPQVAGYRPGVGWIRWRRDLEACVRLFRRAELSPLALMRSLPRVRVLE